MCEISIILPVYNKSRYLKKTLECLRQQTFRDYELLLVDDGSTDGSGSICDAYSASDARVKTFHTENHGVSAARNLGIRMAAGKYIGFIDADDLIAGSFLEKLYDAMEKNGAEMAVCGYRETRYAAWADRGLPDRVTEKEPYDILFYNVLCVLWNKLFVREKIQHGFIEGLSTAEDSLFCVQYYLDNRPKIAYVWEYLYGYQRHGDGLTGSIRKGALRGILKLYHGNRKILSMLPEGQLKNRAFHHICKVYFYGIYTFLFENACNAPMNGNSLSIIAEIIKNGKYRRTITYILQYPLCDPEAEKTTKKEILYILFSLLKMKRAIYVLAKVKKWTDPYKTRL